MQCIMGSGVKPVVDLIIQGMVFIHSCRRVIVTYRNSTNYGCATLQPVLMQ